MLSQKVLSLDDFLKIVKYNHPIAKQSNLLNTVSKAELLAARGGFEPKIEGDFDNKTFDGKNYFSIGDYGLKVPSWYGLEFKAGYKTLTGINTDPSDAIPTIGQAVVGVKASLLQNLIIDERRATLQKARLLNAQNAAAQKEILNDLLLDASKAYLDWTLTYEQLRIYENSISLAKTRFEGVKQQFQFGDKAAIDTLESFVLLQDRQFEYSEAYLDYTIARIKTANFLWNNNEVPLEIDSTTTPNRLQNASDTADISTLVGNINLQKNQIAITHPSILSLSFKQKQLEIDRKLKREKLKPMLDVNYNILGNGLNFNGKDENFLNNYRWGISLSTPILFRKARGEVELANIKIADNRFKQQQKTLDLQNKLMTYYNELLTNQQQIRTYAAVASNYSKLLEGENERFRLGESSIFLLNSRERKVIEAQLKINKLQTTSQKLKISIDYANGVLSDKY